ncbi:bifunctional diaminohydroxyphosphoribosylaminopyrimidine deaminase/5-amino-6-(5-phosphoribosylamino)uracil reductase RibD [Solimonas marina]|uniref:Riboflavin biosynthesis protein RibD n=1 Tax=Solimonas marina TaxID=2714601 RepID=A0A969WEM7_9GAMM|nr:bifunctional diaminohydroxyphosphoribosylaminopyrimidine deaminase/5-amino-6-(5-phosphoribosylamino)uracil reductase RibD [Solimonas marina]NKF24730.1 bifunctional diaminohydroxyphosphoribosylaminopyrimidine deaminase/5-amino-6-(5-phosphoribosylamino)uracil reductase RibD [Solimonas marina]
MARALQLAERGRYTTHPNPRVGCVIVAGGEVVGEGAHLRAGEPHAEVHALRDAGARARGAEVYVTLEPCSHHGRTPPCADALIAAGVAKVVVAMRDPNPQVAGRGIETLRAAGVAVETGLMEAAAQALNRGFVSRMTRGRPWLTLKLAASLDGRTAMASGESQWITSAEARADVHRLRAACGAVMTGSATVLADDPQLSVRDLPMSVRQPDRIVLDTNARVPPTARVWQGDARRYWLVGDVPSRCPDGVEIVELPRGADGRLALDAALAALAAQGVNEVLLECGAELAGAFLLADAVDEIVAYLAPSLLGDAARPFARLPGLDQLAQRIALHYTDVRQVGPDLRLSLRPQRRTAE